MKSKKKICRGRGKYADVPGCGKEKYIFSNGLCASCVPKKPIRSILSPVSSERVNIPPKGGNGFKSTEKRKPTGYLALFKEIWDERPHVSEISGLPLLPKGHPKWYWQFSHILESPYKGYGFPLRKDNVVLMLPDEHTMYGEKTTEAKKDTRFTWVFKKKVELILEYNQIKSR